MQWVLRRNRHVCWPRPTHSHRDVITRHDDILLIEEGCELLHCVHATPAIIDAILSSFLKISGFTENGTELCPDGNENEAGGDEDDDDRAPRFAEGSV